MCLGIVLWKVGRSVGRHACMHAGTALAYQRMHSCVGVLPMHRFICFPESGNSSKSFDLHMYTYSARCRIHEFLVGEKLCHIMQARLSDLSAIVPLADTVAWIS